MFVVFNPDIDSTNESIVIKEIKFTKRDKIIYWISTGLLTALMLMSAGMYFFKHEMAWWTRFETLLFLVIIVAWVAAYYFLDLNWLKIPWTPLALIGNAVAIAASY